MPIVMDGYVVVPADRLLEHVGHNLTARQSSPVDGSVAILDCINCHDTRDPLELAREHREMTENPFNDLPQWALRMALEDADEELIEGTTSAIRQRAGEYAADGEDEYK